jgi:ribosome-interacting GTPase 1
MRRFNRSFRGYFRYAKVYRPSRGAAGSGVGRRVYKEK